jgi:hypothetical protein
MCMWAAKGEVNICRVFLENFSGDQVGPRGHRCPPTYQYTGTQTPTHLSSTIGGAQIILRTSVNQSLYP